jgi:multidrug efflux pump subunit AcrA (membrane-fusion protein)
MFVNVLVSPRTISQASVVPVQAVQTGPEHRFLFVIGEDRKVAHRKVGVDYIDEGIAVVTGIEPGTKVVVEGAQNLRPGSLVSLGDRAPGTERDKAGGKSGGGKAPGAKAGAPS